MNNRSVSFEEILELCKKREVDLVLSPSPPPAILCFRGQFDGYGDFFSIVAQDVEYLDVAGGFTVGSMLLTSDIKAVATMTSKWTSLNERFSGPALVIRTADSDSWQRAAPQYLYVIIANNLLFEAGVNWPGAAAAAPRLNAQGSDT